MTRNLFYSLILLLLLSFLFVFISNNILSTEDLIINSFGNQFSVEQLEQLFELRSKWELASYIFIPFLLLIKISIIAGVLDIGCFFFNRKIKYKKIFSIVTKAEFIFLLVILFKTIWFYIIQQDYSLEDLQYFYPLSALNIVGYEGLQLWYIYPLQVLNLFELIFWLILAYLIGKELQITLKKGLVIVAGSYGIGLLIWVVGIMFLTLNMS